MPVEFEPRRLARRTLQVVAVLVVPRLGVAGPVPPDAKRVWRAMREVRNALVGGTREAVQILRSRNLLAITGAVGYWAWDNAVLWAAFHASAGSTAG
jgi:hypothetical protein